MAAKCNITQYALQELYKLQYGLSCKTNDIDIIIIENYLDSIRAGCNNVIYITCNNDQSCNQGDPVFFTCNFNILSISATLNPINDIDNSNIIFDLKVINYAGGKLPFQYTWSFDSDDFELVEGTDITSDEIKLKLKPDKVLELLITEISVEVTDVDGCTDNKSCWLTPEGMQCSINFIPCSNPGMLSIVYNYNSCSQPKTLVVSNS